MQNFDDLKYYETCVFACSGPSLNKIDPFSLGFPVVAISTAIRKITNPNYWVYSDYLNEMHGEEGKQAYLNDSITKIIQDGKSTSHLKSNNLKIYLCEKTNREYDRKKVFKLDIPFLKGPHKSITFGIQWAHSIGVKNIIFAGNDLKAESMETKYCYPVNNIDMKKKHNFKKTLDEVENYLRDWYPIAQSYGYNWYSWECGSTFESFVPKLTEDIHNKLLKKEFIQQPMQNQEQVIPEISIPNEPNQMQKDIHTYMRLINRVKKL